VNQVVDEVLGRIDDSAEDIVELCLTLGNTYGPVGFEKATADAVHRWAKDNELAAVVTELVDDRANVVCRLPGTGNGRSILFNAHLDTEASGPDYDRLMAVPDPNLVGARREGSRLFGHTVLNDRGCLAITLVAGRELIRARAPLSGDVILTGVAGETGQAPVDEYQGLRYEGKGFGSTYLVEHGQRADYALVAETTDFAPCWHACGANYYKVTVRGRNMYTPRLERGDRLEDHPNAIVKAAAVVSAIEDWARAFEAARTGSTPCGEVRPKAQVGAIRGGIPWRCNRSSPYCALYVDVRTLPDEDPDEITRILRGVVDDVGVGAEVELILSKPGALGTGVEPLLEAVKSAHTFVKGTAPPAQAEAAVVSMWRDTNVFNRAGIPSLTFGPSRGRASVQGEGHFELQDLVDGAKMYALIALQVAGELDPRDLEGTC
jgi:acetylornithine deacetylase/succinyl-diaminopimelate desuccinylase-like protein